MVCSHANSPDARYREWTCHIITGLCLKSVARVRKPWSIIDVCQVGVEPGPGGIFLSLQEDSSPEVEPGATELREFDTLATLDVDKFDRMKKKVERGIRCSNRLVTWPRLE